jgi:hypothetical protein
LQYDYRKPYFAVNPFYNNPVMTKKVQTVGLLLGMKHKDADEMIADLICSSDFHTAYSVLMQASGLKNSHLDDLFGLSTSKERFDAIVEKARGVHGELVDKLLAVLEEQERIQNIVMRRGSITGEEHRFFLALLLNVPNREKVLELVKQRFPDVDPVEKILDWVEELSQTRVLGSKEPNALGIEGFGDDHIVVLENLLRGISVELMRTGEASPMSGPRLPEDKLDKLAADLQNSTLFKTLLN